MVWFDLWVLFGVLDGRREEQAVGLGCFSGFTMNPDEFLGLGLREVGEGRRDERESESEKKGGRLKVRAFYKLI